MEPTLHTAAEILSEQELIDVINKIFTDYKVTKSQKDKDSLTNALLALTIKLN